VQNTVPAEPGGTRHRDGSAISPGQVPGGSA